MEHAFSVRVAKGKEAVRQAADDDDADFEGQSEVGSGPRKKKIRLPEIGKFEVALHKVF